MQNRSRILLASMFAGLLGYGTAALATPDLSIVGGSGDPGTAVSVAVNYVAGGEVAAMDFEITYDSTKLTPGPRVVAAGFPNQVSANAATAGKLKVLVKTNDDGVNLLPVPSASPFATIPFTITAGTAAGDLQLTIANVVMSNKAGVAVVPTSAVGGKITVKGGAVTVALPNVVGMTEQAARGIIPATMTVVVNRVNNAAPADQVIAQAPAAGQVAANITVTLTVSNGPGGQTATLPNVVGMTEAQARAAIPATMTVVVNRVNNAAPVGQVIAQAPAAGVIVANSAVTLTVSLGPLLSGAAPVPTLSEWALMLLVLAVGTIVWMRKPQQG